MNKMQFTKEDLIGQVVYVDTNQVLVEVENDESINLLNVGSIVSIQTTRTYEFTIGLIDKVKRKVNELLTEDENEIKLSSDLVQVSLIGTYLTVDGDVKNRFKRGIDTFPQITHACHMINGENLKLFMNIISNEINVDKQLSIGNFTMDKGATAILDGDKFFQRHAAILGSTGSGKSWCVANLLEQASRLNNPNIIVFDIHGEYTPLCEQENGYGQSYKIAGPGDLEDESENLIFLPYWLLNRDEML